MIRIKRAYENASAKDGTRILVDRFWPRGINKQKIRVSEWMRDIAPSRELLGWFGHEPRRWEEFEKRYREELADKKDLLEKLRTVSQKNDVTLVYSARDELHNQTLVIKKLLEKK